jgi:antitoxin component HigA of HigAB toxin-antitoxin module
LSEELDYDLYRENYEETLMEILQVNFAKDQTEDFAQNLARQCSQNEPDAIEKVNELLDATGLRLDDILDDAKDEKAQELARAYARREPDAIEKVNELLASSGRTMDDLMAKKFTERIDCITNIERFDRLITIAETRLKASLHEIYQHRAVLGEALRRNVQEIEDGEFEVIQETPAKGKNVA